MKGSPNKKDLPKSPETGRRSRDLISGFRILASQDKGTTPVRKWALDWLLYLEGFTDEKPSAVKPDPEGRPTGKESPEEEKLRMLLKENEDVNDSPQQE